MEKQNVLHIACGTDDNYAMLCSVMLCSLLENNKGQVFCVHVLINCLNDINKQRLKNQVEKYDSECRFHEIDDKLLDGCQFRKSVHTLSNAAYYRILLPSLLRKVDKILYIDCDMVVLGSVNELFKIDMTEFGVAAVEDYGLPQINEHLKQLDFDLNTRYFNSGFMLISLDYWRNHEVESKLLDFSKSKRKVFFHDQDSLNYVFKEKWLRLPPKWNHLNVFHVRIANMFLSVQEFEDFFDTPCVIHYSDKYFKPWFSTPLIPYKKIWIKYLYMSEWNDFVLRYNERKYYTILKIIYVKVKLLMFKLEFMLRFCFFNNLKMAFC